MPSDLQSNFETSPDSSAVGEFDKLSALPEPFGLNISEDSALPQSYGVEFINLLPQSPARLFLHWNLAHDPLNILQRIIGADAKDYRLVVRLINETQGEETWHDATASRAMWFDVAPSATYRAQLFARAEARPLIHLLSSDATTTPRRDVAPADDAPEFQTENESFAQMLHETGYTHAALAVALEHDKNARLDEATIRFALSLTGIELPLLRDDEMNELRALLSAIAFGESLDEFQLESPRLAEWLARVRGFDEPTTEELNARDLNLNPLFETTYGGSHVHFVTSAPPDRHGKIKRRLPARLSQRLRAPLSTSINPSRVWLPEVPTSGKF